jgi:hypothetical protein
MTLFNVLTGIASIVGLLFSYLAWQRAKEASEAAENARKAVTIRTLADEFQLACERVDQLLDFVAHDRFAEASLRASELASTLSEIPFRRSPYLSEESKDELLNARENARILSQVLATGLQGPFSIEQKQRFVRQCQKISTILRKNLGTIRGEIDLGATL